MFPAERDEHTQLTFAWTGRDMNIRLPGLDRRQEWTLDVRARSGRAEPAQNPVALVLTPTASRSRRISPRPASRVIHVVIPARPQRPRGAILRMDVSATIVPGPERFARARGDGGRSPASHPPATSGRPAAQSVLPPPAPPRSVRRSRCSPRFLRPSPRPSSIGAGQAALLSRGFGPYTEYPVAAAWLAAWIALGGRRHCRVERTPRHAAVGSRPLRRRILRRPRCS